VAGHHERASQGSRPVNGRACPKTDRLMGSLGEEEQKAGQGFLRGSTPGRLRSRCTSKQGYNWAPPRNGRSTRFPCVAGDPVLKAFKGPADVRRLAGYAGPPDRKSAEVIRKYFIVDMIRPGRSKAGRPRRRPSGPRRVNQATRDLIHSLAARNGAGRSKIGSRADESSS